MAPDVTLAWGKDGREAIRHEIYVGAEPDNLSLAGNVSESSFDTLALDLQPAQTYHWRVDEINEAMDPSTWLGDVWSFTTAGTPLLSASLANLDFVLPPDQTSTAQVLVTNSGDNLPVVRRCVRKRSGYGTR